MPVFNLELKFNGKGAQDANKQIDTVSDAASKAQQSVEKLGNEASSSSAQVATLGKQGVKAGADISAAMKRAAKDLLALVGAYKAVGAAMNFINRGIEFNSSMEESQIGIASLITSMVKLEDAQGRALEGAQKYAAAQGIAAELMQEIQRLGLETTATTQSLVEGVQMIMGPALQAGMALKDIPQFAVAGAQAMQTLGVPLNQMRTELDALLTGNINKSQDILAPKLFADVKGDLGEYIRGLKESGKLIDEIMRRLKPFQLAGQDVAQTWKGLTSNLEEAMDKLAGDSGRGLANSLKESISEVQNLLLSTEQGSVGIGENFQNIAQAMGILEDRLGGAILSSVQSLVSLTKDFNKSLGDAGAINVIDDLTTALKTAAGALVGLAAARKGAQISVAIAGERERLLEEAKATALNAQERIKDARAAREEWAATKQFVEQEIRNLSASKQSAETTKQLAAYRQELKIATNGAAAAERDLSSAMATSRAARDKILKLESGAGKFSAIGSKLKTAWSGLIGLFGGPWGLALTGASAALSFLAVKQTDAERAAKLHTEAEEAYQSAVKGAADASGNLTRQLTQVEKARLNIAKNKYEQEWAVRLRDIGGQIEDLRETVNAVNDAVEHIAGEDIIPEGVIDTTLTDMIDSLDILYGKLKGGQISFEEFQTGIAKLREEAIRGGYENSQYAKVLEGLLSSKTLEELADKLRAVGSSIAGMAQEVRVAKQEMASGWDINLGDAENVLKHMREKIRSNKAELAGVKSPGLMKLLPDFDPGEIKVAQEAYRTALKETKDEAKSTEAALATLGEKGRSATEQTKKTLGQALALTEQLASTEDALDKKRAAARKAHSTGIKTVASAQNEYAGELERTRQQVESLQQQLGLDHTEDLTRAKIKIEQRYQAELSKTNEELAKRVARGQLTPEQADTLRSGKAEAADLERRLALKEAEHKEEEKARKTLETRVSFYKELEQLSGEYGLSLDYQNQLIAKQAEEWRLAGISVDDVNRRVGLMRQELSRSPFDGMIRGARKFGAEYGDMAAQIEGLTTQFGSHISNTLADAFMKGKLSMGDFFNSMIAMAAQAASNAFIGQIFSGIGGLFTSGSTITTKGFTNADLLKSSWGAGLKLAKGGVASGGNLSDYSGRVVTSPTFFAYDRHLSAFANGAGLMGEAGPEAIMPLARTTRGDLGVRMVWGEDMAREAYHTDDWKRQRGFSDNTMRMIADMQAVIRRERQSQMNAAPQITINVINNSNAQVEAGQMRQDGNGGFTMDIILSQVDAGLAGRMRQGKSQTMQYIEKTYGLGRAGVLARGRGRS